MEFFWFALLYILLYTAKLAMPAHLFWIKLPWPIYEATGRERIGICDMTKAQAMGQLEELTL